MKIKRKKLLNDLQDFAARGNGVIIGSPGVGKTYLLKELYLSLESLEIPVFILPIDQLGDGTDKTLREELSYEGDLIERLKSVPISNQKAILLFDAFDAARDEQTRKNFLRLIRRAIQELKGIWNIVVTVRTYDAKKSHELLDLFGRPDDIEYQSEGILCRHFTIPPFSEDEILQALEQIGAPQYIYNKGSKNILANPFNLWLLAKVISNLSDQDLIRLSQIRSEIQLLRLFWHRRIGAADNEICRIVLLDRIAREMVAQRSLSIRQSDISSTLISTAWEGLLSDEILVKVSSTGQRIAFSHNILFDYAVSLLLIDDEPQHLEEFVLEDPSRPLFLRPSLTYFFTRLWYYDSESFWKAFWHIFSSDQSVHLRLVARLIPTSVIANEAHKIDQLMPLLEKLRSVEKREIANEAVTCLLQALQTLQIRRAVPWIDFFDKVSIHLNEKFAWDLADLTSAILERVSESENSEVVNACGRIGRRLLEWVWQARETGKSTWYDRFGGRSAVPLVTQTYHTNPEESRRLLEKILELPKKDNFPITFLSSLTDHVDKIWKHDPEFVTLIYRTVFHHNESSDGKTSLSGGVLVITSTRRQDYSMCRYRLIKHFPGFLQAA
ncbi:MAG: ATP-binding protein, partial [Candidatus Poribacteria bacterium]|nr:ATP-binding protein [Candidatus Poribacteria bacterium]